MGGSTVYGLRAFNSCMWGSLRLVIFEVSAIDLALTIRAIDQSSSIRMLINSWLIKLQSTKVDLFL